MLEAKDTLLSQEEILKIRGNDNSFEPADIKRIKRLNKYLRRQAEISFKAGIMESYPNGFLDGGKVGRKGGIKEVVEWMTINIFEVNGYPAKELWEAKLKEWGIEND